MIEDPLDQATIARVARELRARYGNTEAVRLAQKNRADHPDSSVSASFWSRVVAQLLYIERPAPEHATAGPEELEANAQWFRENGLAVSPLASPSAKTSTTPEPEQGSLF